MAPYQSWKRCHNLFGQAYIRAATSLTAVNGFRKTGILPVNRDIFQDHDFAPAEPTVEHMHAAYIIIGVPSPVIHKDNRLDENSTTDAIHPALLPKAMSQTVVGSPITCATQPRISIPIPSVLLTHRNPPA